MAKPTKFEQIVADLNRNPSEENWKEFAKALKNSGIKYYTTVYANDKINRLKDLKESYVVLRDGRYKVVTKVPVYKKNSKGGIEGALEHLMGLLNANMVNK